MRLSDNNCKLRISKSSQTNFFSFIILATVIRRINYNNALCHMSNLRSMLGGVKFGSLKSHLNLLAVQVEIK